MEEVILKGIGFWLLTVFESIIVFLAFCIGKWTNGLPIEMAMLLGTILAATQILIVLIIKHYFKIE